MISNFEKGEIKMKSLYFTLMIAFIVGIYALMSYLFQLCWNMGAVPMLGANEIDFATGTYMVGLLTLTGYFVRGWGTSLMSSNNKGNSLFKD